MDCECVLVCVKYISGFQGKSKAYPTPYIVSLYMQTNFERLAQYGLFIKKALFQ